MKTFLNSMSLANENQSELEFEIGHHLCSSKVWLGWEDLPPDTKVNDTGPNLANGAV